LKILSYNIWEGGQDRLPLIQAVIACEAPDLVALIEANVRANAESLAAALGMDLIFGESRSDYHVAWLSRLPVRRSQNHNLSILAKTLLEIEVAWEDTPVHAFATHLASRWDDCAPLEEIPAILSVVDSYLDGLTVLAGDFNALAPGERVGPPPPDVKPRPGTRDDDPRPVIRRVLDAGLVDCYRQIEADAPGYTYQANHPWLRIDYIFASSMLSTRLHSSGILTDPPADRASDHLAIWAEFS
jgi:endonuclease/exonuclease/phosphatase family metal-dependent hydrolase